MLRLLRFKKKKKKSNQQGAQRFLYKEAENAKEHAQRGVRSGDEVGIVFEGDA